MAKDNPDDSKTTAGPPCNIDSKAIISEKAIIVGSHPITIGANTVLHPYAKVDSTNGPVTIGQSCIVAERASIGLLEADTASLEVRLDDYVTIETNAVVQSLVVGRASIVGPSACLHPTSQVGQFCKILPACNVPRSCSLADFTVLTHSGEQRHDATTASRPDVQQLKLKGQTMHVDTLRRLVPTNVARWQ